MDEKKKGNPQNLRPVQTKEEARTRGANGGKKSGEVRRKKRDAKKAISYLLNMAAKGNLVTNLEKLGFEEEDMTNMMALQAALFTRAIAGDNSAYKMLMDYGGYSPETQMRERESDQRIEESKAKAKYYEEGGIPLDGAETDVRDDVIIYLPEQDEEV